MGGDAGGGEGSVRRTKRAEAADERGYGNCKEQPQMNADPTTAGLLTTAGP